MDGMTNSAVSLPTFERPHSTDDMCNALHEHGVILLRDVVSGSLASELRQRVDEWYVDNAATDTFSVVNGISGGHLRGPVDPLLEEVSFTAFKPVAKAFLSAERVAVPINHLLFRRRDDAYDALREPEGIRHLFHQDHGLIPESFPLNAWIALSEVDADRHGLTFVLPCPKGPTLEWKYPEDYVARHGGGFCSPEMSPGDMLIFHRFTIHGSWLRRGKTKTRYSVEFRAGDPASAPDDYANVLWHLLDN